MIHKLLRLIFGDSLVESHLFQLKHDIAHIFETLASIKALLESVILLLRVIIDSNDYDEINLLSGKMGKLKEASAKALKTLEELKSL